MKITVNLAACIKKNVTHMTKIATNKIIFPNFDFAYYVRI